MRAIGETLRAFRPKDLLRHVGSVSPPPRRARRRPRIALALGGGGVIGGMYEAGALTALEERLDAAARGFDIYVGCSSGSVLASLLASGVQASELYRILDQDLDDPLNFRRGAVFSSDSFRRAAARFGRLIWAFGKCAIAGARGSVPDMIAQADRDLPAGFFSLGALESFVRDGLASRGLPNSFADVPRRLFVPAVDLERGERVVFGRGELRDVPISQAVAASSAIPGFFEPYPIGGRTYVDGGVGFTDHADIAADAGADIVFVIYPMVPSLCEDDRALPSRGIYGVMDQVGRIYSHNLLRMGLGMLSIKFPRTKFFLLEPPRSAAAMLGPSMGFGASRTALRFGYESTREWLGNEGSPLVDGLRATQLAFAR